MGRDLMSRGLFAAQINEAERILRSLGLLEERNYAPSYNRVKAADFRGLSYSETWEKCYSERFFDFLLADDSIMQFRASFDPLDLGYAFYENPYAPLVSFDQFVEQELLARGDEIDEYDLVRDYQLLTPELKIGVTPLRYDYAPAQYAEGLHPASHMHFGHAGHVRVGTRKILRPLSFLFFTLRQCYPDSWRVLTNWAHAPHLCRNVHEELDPIDGAYWRVKDTWEMSLS